MSKLEYLEQEALYIIRAYARDRSAVSFSGGKDSLVALHLAIRAGVKEAVFCDTTIEFDETIEYVEYVSRILGNTLTIVRPPRTFFELTHVFGFPSRRSRWCCEALKFAPQGKYAIENNITSFITGLRSEESRRRKTYGFYSKRLPSIPTSQVNPLINWSEDDVWAYIEKFNLYVNPLYERARLRRIGCWPCPFKTRDDWKKIEQCFPELILKLKKELSKSYNRIVYPDTRNGFAWDTRLHLQTSEIKGEIRPVRDGVETSLYSEADMMKVLKLLPVLGHEFVTHGKKSVVVRGRVNLQKMKILVEKSINCVGCGACLSTCKTGALFLDGDQISVRVDKCTLCRKCLISSSRWGLRGACLRRNYAPTRYEVKVHDNSMVRIQDKELYKMNRLCGGGTSWLIRTRVQMKRLMRTLSRSCRVATIGSTFIVRHKNFTLVGGKRRGMVELTLRIEAGHEADVVAKIRSMIALARRSD